MNDIRHKDVWITIHCGLTIEVVHFEVGNPHINEGKGIWNYYVYIHENKTKHFSKLWLKDKREKFTPQSPERIDCDYYSLPIVHDAKWHGGITYYAKHGHSIGHRCVQIGCDFNHLWDQERGFPYTLDDVIREARETAQILALLLDVKQN